MKLAALARSKTHVGLSAPLLALLLCLSFSVPAHAVDLAPAYSATWEKELGGGAFCVLDPLYDQLLSATGTFQVGLDTTLCDADVRGVLEFDLAGLPGTVLSAQLRIRRTAGFAMAPTITVHGFSGNGATDAADANVDNVVTSFVAPAVGDTAVIDVTAYVNSLLAGAATHVGFTLDGGGADVVSFAGLSDPEEPVLAVDDGQTPIAEAGVDQTLVLGAGATLDGSASSDPDGNLPLSFDWQILSAPLGSSAVLFAAATSSPSLTPDVIGTYVVELVVTDTEAKRSDPDTVAVRAQGDVVVEAGYSATWEKEVGEGIQCSMETEFDELLSSMGSFRVGLDNSFCNAELRGVLEFDLSAASLPISSAWLVLHQYDGTALPVSFTVHGFSGNGLVEQADANIDNAVTSFMPPGIGEQVVIDVTSHVGALIGAGATHAGVTIDGGGANDRDFDGTGDPEPPRLHLFLAPVAVPGPSLFWLAGGSIAIALIGARWLQRTGTARRAEGA